MSREERLMWPGKLMCFWPDTAMDRNHGNILGGLSRISRILARFGCSKRPSSTSSDQFRMYFCARIQAQAVHRLLLSVARACGVLVNVLRITSLCGRPRPCVKPPHSQHTGSGTTMYSGSGHSAVLPLGSGRGFSVAVYAS